MERRPVLWLTLAAGLVLAALAINLSIGLRNVGALRNDAAWVAHTHEVLLGLEHVVMLATDAETGQRGYVLTGQRGYLAPYQLGIASVGPQVDTLAALTRDNAAQQASLADLRPHLATKLAEMGAVIAVRDSIGLDAARAAILSGRGRVEMDSVRAIVAVMSARERSLLAAREQRTRATFANAVGSALLGGMASILGVLAYLWLLQRHLAARQRDARSLAEQGERLRTTLASIGDAVIATDTRGRLTILNPVAERLTGWPAADALGRPLAEVFHIVHEVTREPAPNPVERALREGAIVGLANHTVLVGRDGLEWPIEDSAAPIRCAVGEIVGCVLVFRDVSARRAADRALMESEERLRLAVGAAQVGTWVWDLASDRVRADERVAAFHGIPAAQLAAGLPSAALFDRVDLLDLPHVRADVDRAIASAGSFETEYRVRGEDGVERWVRSRGRVESDAAGRPFRIAGATLDVTQRRAAEESLRDADRHKDEFLATLAHELRNPLAPIRNGLHILGLTPDSAEAAKARHMMERQLGQMVGLIDDLLDLSRISQGKIALRTERVDLGRLVDDAVVTVRPAIEQAGHALTVELPREPIHVEADVTRLSQVFDNLLTNAAKYTERGGRIAVAVRQDGTEASVTVTDTGIGIPPTMLPRIFEMFTQIERSTERAQGGLGIGLWLVRRLVGLHGGRVRASSEGAGRGSVFEVRLPLAGPPAATPAAPPAEVGAWPLAGRRILVVDDNRDSASSLALLLELKGNQTRVAHDGLQGLEVAAAYHPEIMLLDIGMPKLDGYATARRVREAPWGRDVVLIALTGWGQEHDRMRSHEAGFDHHLVKPVDPDRLLRLLASLSRA